jgi:CHAD domain-containing protein
MVASTEARKFAAEHAQKSLRQLAFDINRVTKSRDAESVLGLRLSLRKFSQTLQLFRDFFPGEKVHKINKRVKKITRAAQELRNFDTTLRLLSKGHRGGSSTLRSKLQARRKECERMLVDLLKRWLERKSSSKWRAALQAAVARTDKDMAKITIQAVARKAMPESAGKFLKRGKEAVRSSASLSDLHDCRVGAIKLRYALELFGSISRSPLSAWLADVKQVQTVLGELTDSQAARELVSSYAIADEFDGWLKKKQRKSANVFRQFWAETFANRVVKAMPAPRLPRKPPTRITSTTRSAHRKPAAVA